MSYVPIVTPGRSSADVRETSAAADKTSRIVSQAKLKRAQTASAQKRPAAESFPIIVHCHLCWDWVWQRPQQFLSRLSERHKILFVETVGPDPQLNAACARFRSADGFPNITF